MDRAHIEAVLQSLCPENGPGIAAGIFRDGALLDSYAFGYADVERRQPIDSETSFHVASLSKQFTAYAIALLASRGMLSMDQSVRSILGDLPLDERILVRHLVHHTSGLRDQWNTLDLMGWRPGDPISTDDVLRFVILLDGLNHEPGTKYLYCNTGYTLMGEVVRKVSGLSLQQFLDREVFHPLDMAHTRFREDYRATLPHEAVCYAREGETYVCTTPPYKTIGASSLQTTIGDFAKWTAFLQDIENSGLHDMMHARGQLDDGTGIAYGFGRVCGTLGGMKTLSHSGLDYNFSAQSIYLPEHRIGAAVFSNGTHLALEAVAAWLLMSHMTLPDDLCRVLEQSVAFYAPVASSHNDWKSVAAFGTPLNGDLRLVERCGDILRISGTYAATLHRTGTTTYAAQGALTAYEIDPALRTLTISSDLAATRNAIPALDLEWNDNLAAHVGTYKSGGLAATHEIELSDGQLYWLRPRLPPQKLTYAGDNLFYAQGYLLDFTAEGLVISHPRAHGFVLKRSE